MQQTNAHKPGYKHTPLGWIPEEWGIFDLEAIAEKVMVGIASAATHAYRDSGIVLFRNQNIKDGYLDDTNLLFIDEDYELTHKNKRLKGGDLLTARTGYPGITCVVPKKYEGAQSFTTLITRPNHELAKSSYLCYYINSDRGQKFFESTKIGGGQKNVNAGSLSIMPIPLPSLKEQNNITFILGTWDEAIQKTQQLIAQLKKRNKGLMWKLLTGKKRLKIFGEKWQHVQVRDIASEVSIKNKADKAMTVLSCTKYHGLVDSLEYFGRRVFSEDTSTYKIVPMAHFAYATNHIEEGSIGYQNRYDEALISPMYTVFKTTGNVNDNYLYKVLKSQHYIHEYQKRMEGSIDRRGGLRWGDFSKIPIHLPPIDEQTAIASVLDKATNELKLHEQQLANLQQQKKGLMQKLLSGEVRVRVNKTFN